MESNNSNTMKPWEPAINDRHWGEPRANTLFYVSQRSRTLLWAYRCSVTWWGNWSLNKQGCGNVFLHISEVHPITRVLTSKELSGRREYFCFLREQSNKKAGYFFFTFIPLFLSCPHNNCRKCNSVGSLQQIFTLAQPSTWTRRATDYMLVVRGRCNFKVIPFLRTKDLALREFLTNLSQHPTEATAGLTGVQILRVWVTELLI